MSELTTSLCTLSAANLVLAQSHLGLENTQSRNGHACFPPKQVEVILWLPVHVFVSSRTQQRSIGHARESLPAANHGNRWYGSLGWCDDSHILQGRPDQFPSGGWRTWFLLQPAWLRRRPASQNFDYPQGGECTQGVHRYRPPSHPSPGNQAPGGRQSNVPSVTKSSGGIASEGGEVRAYVGLCARSLAVRIGRCVRAPALLLALGKVPQDCQTWPWASGCGLGIAILGNPGV